MKKKFWAFGLCLIFSVMLILPVAVGATDSMTTELEKIGGEAYGGATESDLPTIIGRIINVVLGFLGVVLLLIVVYAGFLYMTAGGEPGKTDKAKSWLINAIIGLIIIFAAYAISSFVITSISSATR